jgi:hypothetical protein
MHRRFRFDWDKTNADNPPLWESDLTDSNEL